MNDSLILEVADFEHDVLTGIYSEETGRPQPLRFTIQVRMKPLRHACGWLSTRQRFRQTHELVWASENRRRQYRSGP